MPTAGRHGASPGLSLRASSIFTYSAVARVSSSASTRPPKGRTLVCNADPGRPLLLGHGFRSAGIPWNYSSRYYGGAFCPKSVQELRRLGHGGKAGGWQPGTGRHGRARRQAAVFSEEVWRVSVTWETLAEARDEALGCTKCRLAGGRTQVVWMDGNPEAPLM